MARTRSKRFRPSKSKSKSKSGSSRQHNSRIRNIFSIPRSNGVIPKMLNNDRDIKKVVVKLNNKEEIARLFLAITAKWCGACHAVSDRLNKAIKRTSMAATRIDEQNVPKLNNALNSSIEPPHYPYFIVVNQNAKIEKILSSIEEVEQFLEETPGDESATANSGTESKPPSPPPSPNSASASNPAPVSISESDPSNPSPPVAAMISKNSPVKNQMVPGSNKSIIPDKSLEVDVDDEEEEPDIPVKKTSLNNVGKAVSTSVPISQKALNELNASASASALPPNAQQLDAIKPAAASEPLSPAQGGGSLYASLASTAYQLAPPAVLMGIAAATLKRKSKKRGKKRTQRRKI